MLCFYLCRFTCASAWPRRNAWRTPHLDIKESDFIQLAVSASNILQCLNACRESVNTRDVYAFHACGYEDKRNLVSYHYLRLLLTKQFPFERVTIAVNENFFTRQHFPAVYKPLPIQTTARQDVSEVFRGSGQCFSIPDYDTGAPLS